MRALGNASVGAARDGLHHGNHRFAVRKDVSGVHAFRRIAKAFYVGYAKNLDPALAGTETAGKLLEHLGS